MINKKVDEAVFDAILEQALSDVIEEDIKKLQEEDAPCTISAEADQRIRRMIAQAGKQSKKTQAKRIIRAAVIVLAVLVNVSLIGLLMVPSVNAEVKNVFAELFEKYTSYENKVQDTYVVTTSEYEIGYIPDGFELILNDDKQILLREKNKGTGYISINISAEDFGRTSLDYEYEKSQSLKINGVDAEMRILGDDCTIFWYDGYHFITIYANVEESELINTAKNIEKFK